MPRHEDGYLSKRVAQLMDELGTRSVVAIAQTLKENVCGSAYTMGLDQMDKAAEVIRFYLEYWTEHTIGVGVRSELLYRYDCSVQMLLHIALSLYVDRSP